MRILQTSENVQNVTNRRPKRKHVEKREFTCNEIPGTELFKMPSMKTPKNGNYPFFLRIIRFLIER